MVDEDRKSGKSHRKKSAGLNEKDIEAIKHLKDSVAKGKNWYISVLEAIKIWNSKEEDFKGRHWKYLIDNEAFDWLLLAERLCEEINDYIPQEEKIALLFYDRPPLSISKDNFRKIIGSAKYKAYLNYTYGILVEEALISTVVEEVRKEKRSLGSSNDNGVLEKAFKRIYGAEEGQLFADFMKEKRYYGRTRISIADLKEFYYWLFKYRMKRSEKPRIASDTKKALVYLQHIMESKGTVL